MVCMSTSSRIDKIVPQRHKDPSSRVVHQPRIDPFLALKLNIGEEVRRQQRPHEEILRPISELSAIEFLAGFGRPLWLLLQQKTNDANIQLFVMHKLLGGAPHFDPTDADHVFAALSYKICLDPALNECAMYNSNSLATVHVNSYLRLVIGIDREGGRLKTSTPPEPIVSDVASEILVSPVVGCASRDNWVFSIQTLTEKLVSTGRVEKGITGELYSRLLLILARDYLLATYLRPQAHFLRLSVPFEYSAFLEKLLGLNIVDNIKRELSYKYNSLAHKIEQGWMNFNHFSNTQTPLDGFNRDLDFNFRLISLLRSHSALQCTNLQRQVDMVIPIYFGDCSKKIDPTQVGALFIQSKNRMQPEVPWPKHKNNGQYTNTGRGYHSFYENLYEHTNPLGAPALVVLLLLDVGLSKSSETTFTVLQPEDKAKNGPCVLCIHVHHDYNNPSSTFPFLKDYDGLSDSCSKLIKEFFTDIHSRKQTFSDIGRMIGCTDLEALQLWEKQNTRPESVLGSHSGSRSEARLESLESKGQKRKLDGDDTNSG
ncbi:hypothetical protein BDD12DRAFT_275659 [Trichophaea hybrida]|nr:hypothetical protein BDD12DRAFT_275659 [Trichophaea hybrida]